MGRRYRLLTIALSGLIIMSTALLYLQLVWPAFLPSDLSNPAVATLVNSEMFQEKTSPIFAALRKYNNSRAEDAVPRPDEYHYIDDSSQKGLLITVTYRPVKRVDDEGVVPLGKVVGKVPQYSYRPEFFVRISFSTLLGFLGVLGVEVMWVIFVTRGRSRAQIEFEERVLREYYRGGELQKIFDDDPAAQFARLHNVLENFHEFCKQINIRRAGRKGFDIDDEFDVQDILRALLMMNFSVVKPEESTPSYAGSASRVDFLLHEEEIAVEVKMTRDNLRDRELADELIIDVARYAKHQKCKYLVCFIYDPRGLLKNPRVLRHDISSGEHTMKVGVVVSPAR